MLKVAVIYWSGTGNTEILAQTIAKNMKVNNHTIILKNVSTINNDFFNDDYNVYLLGCPAMGIESLEEDEWRPFFDKLKPLLNAKHVALFGSYAWGNGLWMHKWYDECLTTGALMLNEGFIVKSTPSSNDLKECAEFCFNIEKKLISYE